MDDCWLLVGEIAEYLWIPKDSVYAWIDKKGLPGHRIGRLWKFKRSEVAEGVHNGKAAASQGDDNGCSRAHGEEGIDDEWTD